MRLKAGGREARGRVDEKGKEGSSRAGQGKAKPTLDFPFHSTLSRPLLSISLDFTSLRPTSPT